MVNILIFRTDKIGDFLISCPTIITIKKYFKESHITLISSEKNYNYANNLNIFDKIYIFPKKSFLQKIKFINILRKNKYDYTFIFDGKERSIIATSLIKSNIKVSLSQNIKFYFKFLGIKFVNDNENTNLDSIFQKMLSISNINVSISNYDFLLNRKENNFSNNIPIKQYIQIHLDEKWFSHLYIKSYKNINPTFSEFIDFLNVLSKNDNVLISTGLFDFDLISKLINEYFEKINNKIFMKKNNDKLIFLIYKPTIDDLVSLFKNAKTAILCHPGIIHIASALNIKIIDIIEKDKRLHYQKWTSHIKKYNSIYRDDFNLLKKNLLNKLYE